MALLRLASYRLSPMKTAENRIGFLRCNWRECVGIEPTKRGVSTRQRV